MEKLPTSYQVIAISGQEVRETLPVEERLTIREMPAEMRPRERMLSSGAQALANAELLAILLRTGNPGETALEMATRLLTGPSGLRFLAEATVEDLQNHKGIGLAKAAQVKAALELGRRLAASSGGEKPAVRSPADAAGLVMEEMRYLDREHFRTISLNNKNRVLAVDPVSVGGLSSTLVHPREVFKNSIKRNAAAMVLVHNHPSGDPTPSKEDVEVTMRLAEAGKILGIEVLDHVVVGDHRYVSLKEEGMF